MAATLLTNIIIPEVFNPYVVQETNRLDKFIQAGIVANDSAFDALASQGGNILSMPYWNDLTGDSEELSDGGPLSVNAITSGKDLARLNMRGKAWGVNDLATALSGDDPMGVIASRVAKFWMGERSKALFNTLKGVETTLAATNVLDISALAGVEGVISVGTTLDAKQKFGENAELITAIAMHSAVYTKLQKNNEIDFVTDSQTQVQIPTYIGYKVIVDDQCPVDAGVYTTYLFGQGAIALGQGGAPVPTETDRDSLAGEDVLINRQHFLLHPRGIKWNEATVAADSPTFAELATAANWTLTYTPTNVRIIIFKHKIV
jgi:hypothetical protein